MHLQSQAAYAHIDAVLPLLSRCHLVALELDLKEAERNTNINQSLLPDFQRLQDLIPSKKYEKLKKLIFKVCAIDIKHFDRLLPLLTANYINSSFLPKHHPIPLDQFLYQKANALNIPVTGLEQLDEQTNLLLEIPITLQVKELLELGRQITTSRKRFLKMADLYAEGDHHRLYHSIRKSNGGLRQSMIFNRNRTMHSRLLPLLEEKSVFCAVGAGHLGGNWGLLALLKRSGYKLTPISTRNIA